jgi:hypothetical protein
MKKKYISYKWIVGVVMAFSFTSCFDLEYEEYGKIDSNAFPESEADLEAATIGVYHTLGKSFIATGLDNTGWTLNELNTDELNTSWGHVWEQTEKFLWTPNNTAAKNAYEQYHKGITKATRIIDNFQKSSINEKTKDRYIAELRVLRAFYAELLYNMFGAVPIVTDPAIATNVYAEWKPTRPTKEEYLSFLIDELTEAPMLLDTNLSGENWGRFSKGAGLMLLMKIYLNDKQWLNAEKTAREIIALNTYELLPSYKSIFDINNEGSSNKEVIFPIQRITSNTSYAWSYFACVMPSTPLYKPKVGTMSVWGGLKMPWAFYDKYEDQDSRLETIVRYYTDVDGNQVDYRQVEHPKATGAAPMKYSEDPEHKGSSQGNDFIVYRYADVLLSLAEALNELHGPTAESIELINQIRKRSSATEISLQDFNKETLRSFILDERGRELYCEGHRRPDLIRHGKFIEYAQNDGMSAKEYHVLFPIPQGAMDENSNLIQNPGYEN